MWKIGRNLKSVTGRPQAIVWTNAGILLIRPLGTNFSEILIENHIFSFKKCVSNCRLQNGGHFASASMWYNQLLNSTHHSCTYRSFEGCPTAGLPDRAELLLWCPRCTLDGSGFAGSVCPGNERDGVARCLMFVFSFCAALVPLLNVLLHDKALWWGLWATDGGGIVSVAEGSDRFGMPPPDVPADGSAGTSGGSISTPAWTIFFTTMLLLCWLERVEPPPGRRE